MPKGNYITGLKICCKCGLKKDIEEDFYADFGHSDWKTSRCKACFKPKGPGRKPAHGITLPKVCSKCKIEKPASEFSKVTKKRKTALFSLCKPCHAAKAVHDRSQNPESHESVRRRSLRNYGLTPEQFKEILDEQGGTCAICGIVAKTFYVDHCHISNCVRGLLCIKCNSGIGLLQDSVQIVEKAVEYLLGASARIMDRIKRRL